MNEIRKEKTDRKKGRKNWKIIKEKMNKEWMNSRMKIITEKKKKSKGAI